MTIEELETRVFSLEESLRDCKLAKKYREMANGLQHASRLAIEIRRWDYTCEVAIRDIELTNVDATNENEEPQYDDEEGVIFRELANIFTAKAVAIENKIITGQEVDK